MVKLPRLPGIERLTLAELRELVRVADDLGISPAELAVVIYRESGFRTGAKNPNSTASGLLQWTEATAHKLGTTTAEIRLMSVTQQLALVRKYLSWYRDKIRTVGDVYIAVFMPIGLGHGDDYVLTRLGEDAYHLNAPLLDRNNDGRITNGDLRSFIKGTLLAYPPTLEVPTVPEQAASVGPALALGALGLWLLWRTRR